jgi:hypothetical protein
MSKINMNSLERAFWEWSTVPPECLPPITREVCHFTLILSFLSADASAMRVCAVRSR